MDTEYWEADLDCQNQYWAAEVEVRKRTRLFTKKEKDRLLQREECWDYRKTAMERMDDPLFTNLFLDWAEEMMQNDGLGELPYQIGETVGPSKAMWSCCKAVMHGLRARDESKPVGCHCLNRVYFQPCGCPCNVNPSWNLELCPKCSICERCGGLLVCTHTHMIACTHPANGV